MSSPRTSAADAANDVLAIKYPLVYKHARNYAAKVIQKTWKQYMMKAVYKYLLECCKEFEENLTPEELSRIFPVFLESSDPKLSSKLRVRMQGESFPPCLVCRIVSRSTSSIDGKKHQHKWNLLFSSGKVTPIDHKALVYLFLEAPSARKKK